MMDNAQSLQTPFHVMAKPIGQSVIWTVLTCPPSMYYL